MRHIGGMNMERVSTAGKQVFRKAVYTKRKSRFGFKVWGDLIKIVGLFIAGFFCGGIQLLGIFHPIALAFFGSISDVYSKSVYFFAASLGIFYKINDIEAWKYIGGMLVFFLFDELYLKKKKMVPLWKRSLLISLISGFCGLVFWVIGSFASYLLIKALAETIVTFLLSILFMKSTEYIFHEKKFVSFTEEESAVLFATGLILTAGVPPIFQQVMDFKLMIFHCFILLAAYAMGPAFGALVGCIAGGILMATASGSQGMVVLLTAVGIISGFIRKYGKTVVALIFVPVTVVFSFMLLEHLPQRPFLFSILGGSVCFLALPDRVSHWFLPRKEEMSREQRYYLMERKQMEERMGKFAQAFFLLSKHFGRAEPASENHRETVPALIDETAARICRGCTSFQKCWKDNFYTTYQSIFSCFAGCEKKGVLLVKDMPNVFLADCPKYELVADGVNRIFERNRSENMWRQRLAECREVIGRQLEAVSSIIREIAAEVAERITVDETAEAEIRNELQKLGVKESCVEVWEEECGMKVRISMKNDALSISHKELASIISKCAGKKMKRLSSTFSYGKNIVEFGEEKRYRMISAAAGRAKDGESGDSYTFMDCGYGKYVMAIADGMGAGTRARKESQEVIELLEQFSEAGFEKDLAVRLINSALMLHSGKELFSTLDLCTVDLYTGKVEFMKTGAASAYIIRSGQAIAIKNTSLPVGILKDVEIQKQEMMLKPGDIIILASDGITDTIEEEAQGGIQWMAEKMATLSCRNPQDIADYILAEILKLQNGEVLDDMMVVASVFWEK